MAMRELPCQPNNWIFLLLALYFLAVVDVVVVVLVLVVVAVVLVVVEAAAAVVNEAKIQDDGGTSSIPTQVNHNNSNNVNFNVSNNDNINIRFDLSSRELPNILSKIARESGAVVNDEAKIQDDSDYDYDDMPHGFVPKASGFVPKAPAEGTFERTIYDSFESAKGPNLTVKEEYKILRKILVEMHERVSLGQCCPRIVIPEDKFPNCIRILNRIIAETGIHIPCGQIRIASTCPGCECRRSDSENDHYPRKRHRE
jgi:hypothetical protein